MNLVPPKYRLKLAALAFSTKEIRRKLADRERHALQFIQINPRAAN